MNAMQQAMLAAIPRDARFPKFNGVVEQREVSPRPHVMIPIKSNGEGTTIRARQVTREVKQVTAFGSDDYLVAIDDCGELWQVEHVSRYVFKAVA